MRTKTWLLLTLVGLSSLVSAYEGVLYWYDAEWTTNVLFIWDLVFIFLLVLWIDADSKDYRKIYRPFEYGYLVLLFWLPYLPYYLWRTRGALGLLALGGFAGLYFMGYLIQWLLHAPR